MRKCSPYSYMAIDNKYRYMWFNIVGGADMDTARKAEALEKFVQELLKCDRDLPLYIIEVLEDITRALDEGDLEELEVVVKWFTDDSKE